MPKQSAKMSPEARASRKKRKEEKKKKPKKRMQFGVPTEELKKTMNRYNDIAGRIERGEKVSKKELKWVESIEELVGTGVAFGLREQAKIGKRFGSADPKKKKAKGWKMRWW